VQQLAVKAVRKDSLDGKVERVMWEVHVMRLLKHQHIVKLLDVIDVAEAVYMVMERVDGPCLLSYIHRQPEGRLPLPVAQTYFAQLAAALQYTHANGFVHCDVKPENVRLDQACERAVLVDWGLSMRCGPQSEPVMHGTPAYAAPELLTGYRGDGVTDMSRHLSETVDVWALGASLVEMLCGSPPFAGSCLESLTAAVLNLRYELPETIPLQQRQIVESMLQLLPSDRASAAELCLHPWVTSSGWLAKDANQVEVPLQCEECSPAAKDHCTWQVPSRRVVIALLYLVACVSVLVWQVGEDEAVETRFQYRDAPETT